MERINRMTETETGARYTDFGLVWHLLNANELIIYSRAMCPVPAT